MDRFRHTLIICLGLVLIILSVSGFRYNFINNNANAQTEINFTDKAIDPNINSGQGQKSINGSIQHVILIIMENKGFGQVIDSPEAPFQNQLAKNYASASNYYGIYPDSLANYIAIISGYPYITKDKDPGTLAPLNEPTIVNLLQSKNLTWKGYFEDMPTACDIRDSGKSGYIAHHDPFVYFDIRKDDRCKNIGGLDDFTKDLSNGNVPNYSFIVPNNVHNTHDSTVAEGDKWLSTLLPKITNSAIFNNTALFLVYDEGQKHDNSGFGSGTFAAKGGRLPLILVSPLAKSGFVSMGEYSHYNLLATIEKILNLGNLGKGDAQSRPMMDLFN